MALYSSQKKEGPGVPKNEKEKKGLFKFFELFARRFWNMMTCGFLYIVLGLPLFTFGLGEVGMAKITRNAVCGRHSFVSDFWDAIKENWKLSLFSGVIRIVLLAAVVYFGTFYMDKVGTAALLMTAISIFALFVLICMSFYIPIVTVTFKVTLFELFKNSFILVFAGIGRNIIILFSLVLFYGIQALLIAMFGNIGLGLCICITLILFPAFRFFCIQYNVFPVIIKYLIDPYVKANPDVDKSALYELGLYNDDSKEPIFSEE